MLLVIPFLQLVRQKRDIRTGSKVLITRTRTVNSSCRGSIIVTNPFARIKYTLYSSADLGDLNEFERRGESDSRTPSERRQERGASRPVDKLFHVLSRLRSTFSESLRCRVQYSCVRHLHGDCRYRALPTNAFKT